MNLRAALLADLTPHERLRITVVSILLVILGFITWALGLIPLPGPQGFVYAAEFDAKVHAIVGDVQKDLGELKQQSQQTAAKVDKVSIALDAVLADYYSKRINEAMRRRCKLSSSEVDERVRLWQQINQDVLLYRQYSGDSTYQRPSCDEV